MSTPKINKKRRWRDREESTVLINQLPYSATEDQIRTFLLQSSELNNGNILGIRMVNASRGPKKDKNSEKFRGIAFVELDTKLNRDAVLSLNGSEFNNERKVNVQIPLDKDSLAEKKALKKKQKVASSKTNLNRKPKATPSDTIKPVDLETLIEVAARPRRQKGGPRSTVSKPVTNWVDFDENSKTAMKSLHQVALKQLLSKFYKSDVVDGFNEHFMTLYEELRNTKTEANDKSKSSPKISKPSRKSGNLPQGSDKFLKRKHPSTLGGSRKTKTPPRKANGNSKKVSK